MRKIVLVFLILGELFLSSCKDPARTAAEVTEKSTLYISKVVSPLTASLSIDYLEKVWDDKKLEIENEAIRKHKEYTFSKKMYSLEKEIQLSGTQKYSVQNIILDSLNGLSCILETEFKDSGYKLPDTYEDILDHKQFKNTENKASYIIKVPEYSSYGDMMNYLEKEYGKIFYYDYIFDEKNQQATAYIYSNTKDPNYVVSGTKLKLEIYKIKREYEGKTREENSTKK